MANSTPIVTETVPITSLSLLPELQIRAGTDQAIIDEYAVLYNDGVGFPAVDCVRITEGDHAGQTVVCDGFHRIGALKKLEIEDAYINVRSGTFSDAIDLATGANASHGLRRTNDDKRRAVIMALTLDKQTKRKRSDRQVAQHIGVHHSTVSEIKAELAGKPKKGTAAKEAVAATEGDAKTSAPMIVIDDLGRRVEDPDVAAALAVGPEFDDIVASITKIQQRIEALSKLPAGIDLAEKVQGLKFDLQGVKGTLNFSRPFTTCPFAPNCNDSCGTCRKAKWITRQVWDLLDQSVRDSAMTGLSESDAAVAAGDPPADATAADAVPEAVA